MGLDSLAMLTEKLMSHGADPDTPAAVVDNGTRPQQQVVTASLGEIAHQVVKEEIPGPAIVIIGTVVTLRNRLSWFKPTNS